MITKHFVATGAISLGLVVVSCTAQAGFTAYLKVDTINGGSQTEGFTGWSDILGYSLNATNSGTTSGGSGGGAGKVTLSPMTVRKHVDPASPVLFGSVLTGKHYPTAEIEVQNDGEKSQTYLKWELEDVLITSYSTSGSSESLLETLAIDYSIIKYSYWPQKTDGSLDEPIVFTWNKKTNSSTLVGAESLADFQFVTSLGTAVPEPASIAIFLVAIMTCLCSRGWQY